MLTGLRRACVAASCSRRANLEALVHPCHPRTRPAKIARPRTCPGRQRYRQRQRQRHRRRLRDWRRSALAGGERAGRYGIRGGNLGGRGRHRLSHYPPAAVDIISIRCERVRDAPLRQLCRLYLSTHLAVLMPIAWCLQEQASIQWSVYTRCDTVASAEPAARCSFSAGLCVRACSSSSCPTGRRRSQGDCVPELVQVAAKSAAP